MKHVLPWLLASLLTGLLLALAYQLHSERMQANSRPSVLAAAGETIIGRKNQKSSNVPEYAIL